MSDSARMRVSAAVTVDAADPTPKAERPKTLRPVSSVRDQSLTVYFDEQRKPASIRKVALKLLQLREETGLTQVDAAALTGDVSSRTVGALERGEVDCKGLRLFVTLLEFRARQRGER